MSDILQIARKKRDSIDILCLSGRLDTNTSPEADAALKQIVAAGSLHILLNVENLEYISSSGLRVMISVLREMKKSRAT